MADKEQDVNPLSMTSNEMAEVIRGERPDPQNVVAASQGPEPEVITEDEAPAPAERATAPARGQREEITEDDPLRKALSTIEGLTRDRDDMKRRLDEMSRPRAQQAEPQVEMMEVMRGISIPKDRNRRFVQLTEDDMKAVNLDPTAAPGLEILANALVERFAQIYNPVVQREIDSRLKSRDDASKGTQSFFNAYPDLAGHEDLLEMVEMRARNQDRVHEHYRGEDYAREIASRTRSRLASFRGQTLEEYESSLDGGRSTPVAQPRGISRATTTPTRRRATAPPQSNLQRELDDL